jgi:hypothetical protein
MDAIAHLALNVLLEHALITCAHQIVLLVILLGTILITVHAHQAANACLVIATQSICVNHLAICNTGSVTMP